jgi:hypothetical protein
VRANSRLSASYVSSTVVGHTRSRITSAWVPAGYIRVSAKSSSKVIHDGVADASILDDRIVRRVLEIYIPCVANPPMRPKILQEGDNLAWNVLVE